MDSEFKLNIQLFREAVLKPEEIENKKYLAKTINYFFDPNKSIPGLTVGSELLQCLTGDLPTSEYLNKIKALDSQTLCKKDVGNPNFAFRCNTCSLYVTHVLCAECFLSGNHEGHDFTFSLKSYERCDCGNHQLIKNCCEKHSDLNRTSSKFDEKSSNYDVLKYAEFIFPHLIYRQIQYLRSESVYDEYSPSESYDTKYNKYCEMSDYVNKYIHQIDVISQLITTCDVLASKLSKYLTNETFYRQKIREENEYLKNDITEKFAFSRVQYKMSKKVALIKYPKQLENQKLIDIECKCLLDELILCWIQTNTVNKITIMLLFLRDDISELFAKSYISKYCLIDNLAVATLGTFINEEDNFNMYFYSDQSVLQKSINEYHLIETLLLTIYNLFQSPNLLNLNIICGTKENYCHVVDINEALVQYGAINIPSKHLYKVLYHSKRGDYLLKNEHLLALWIELISYIQGINIDPRHDPSIFKNKTSFDLENTQSSAIMCLLLNSCMDPSDFPYTIRALNLISTSLMKWLDVVFEGGNKLSKENLSFHLPLHRNYAGFLHKAIYKQNIKLKDLLPTDQSTLIDIIIHPILIQVAMYQQQTNLEDLNKPIIRSQKTYYVHKDYSKYFIDPDIFLVQCVVCQLEQDSFAKTILNAFQVFDICQRLLKNDSDCHKQISALLEMEMVFGALIYIAQIIYREISLDPLDKDSLKNEVLNLLTETDCSLSEIENKLPFTWDLKVSSKDIKVVLDEIADLTQPKSVKEPFKDLKYKLKDIYWEEHYDPLFCFVYRSFGCTFSFSRYSEILKSRNSNTPNNILPPFRLPPKSIIDSSKLKKKYGIANSRSLHSILFTLLYKRLNESVQIFDELFYMVIYLIELAINYLEVVGELDEPNKNSSLNHSFSTSEFSAWFDSDNIFDNISKTIPFIVTENDEKIVVEESMITMFVKILYRTMKTDENGILIVGDECYKLNNLLNKIGKLNKKCDKLIKETLTALDSSSKIKIDDDVKQDNKPIERERSILEKMSKRQQNNAETTNLENDAKNICVLCQIPIIPSLERPIGLICLAVEKNDICLLECKEEKSETTKKTKYFFNQQKRNKILSELFKIESCKQSINIGYSVSTVLESCGHQMHFDCLANFLSGTGNQTFFCTCGMANCLLPIKSDFTKSLNEKIDDSKNVENHIEEALKAEPLYDSNYLKSMFFCEDKTLKDIYQLVKPEYRCIDGKSRQKGLTFFNDNDECLFLTSLLRTQLEVNSFKDKHEIYGTKSRTFFLTLFDLISTRCKVRCYEKNVQIKAWNLLEKPVVIKSNDEKIISEVPVLFRDPISVFLLIISNLSIETVCIPAVFTRIVKSAFNLVYFQSLLIAVLQMSEKQRSNISSNNSNTFNSINDYAAFIVSSLDKLPADQRLSIEPLKDLNSEKDLKLYVEELCLPFFKVVSLLQYYLLGKECNEKESFDAYITNLEIHFDETNSKEPLLKWYDTDPNAILSSWMQELLVVYKSECHQIKQLLSLSKYIYSPIYLIELPNLYTDLIKMYVMKSKEGKRTLTEICLTCGCWCDSYTFWEHLNDCCGRIGIFLSILKSEVSIITTDNIFSWGSIYLDENNQGDTFDQGKQMYLSKERYDFVKKSWISKKLPSSFGA